MLMANVSRFCTKLVHNKYSSTHFPYLIAELRSGRRREIGGAGWLGEPKVLPIIAKGVSNVLKCVPFLKITKTNCVY